MIRLTDVVKNLIIINVILFVITMIIMGESPIKDWLIFHYPGANSDGIGFQPLQIVTHMFMHGSIMHILFNMIMLAFLGPPLEMTWGPKKFLFFYLFAGLGALALHVVANYIEIQNGGFPGRVLGASGAVMGILIGFGYNFPNQKLQLIFPPITLTAKQLVFGVIALDLGMGLFSNGTGVAHFAHLGGALFGFLLIQYWNKFGSRL
ncbi:MAG: rhomboid family intramembrane serine protease [Saprospiraceae bacterium]